MADFIKLRDRIQKLAAPKYIIISTIILFCFGGLTGGVKGTLDMRFSYSPEVAYRFVNNLGDAGRQLYIKVLFFDFGVVIFLALTQMLIIAWLLKKIAVRNKWTQLYLLPVLRGVFDFFENSLILVMLFNYPKEYRRIAMLSAAMTSLKWIAMTIAMAIIVILTAILIWRVIKRKMYFSKGQKNL